MKRLPNVLVSLLGLLALGALAIVLILTLGEQQRRPEPTSVLSQSTPQTNTPTPTPEMLFDSPVETPTPTPGMPFESPVETPTPQPTPTTQPTPTKWRPTPLPTPVRPGGPTPTPLPLPTPAVDASGVLWFLAESEAKQGQVQRDLYYQPLDGEGQPEREEPVHFALPEVTWSRQGMPRLYPSPGGRYLAVIGASGPLDKITIVDLVDHRLLPFYPPTREKVLVLGRFGGWHPDGRHVLYIGHDNRTGLWLVDVENKQPPQYLSEHTPNSAAISPDGQRLAFAGPMVSIVNDRPIALNALWLAWADGSHEKKIFDTSSRNSIFGLSWSPDGSKFVYLQGGAGIWVADADGTNRRLLNRHYASGWGFPPLLWSPDGRLIVFPAQEIPPEKSDRDAYSEAGAFRYVNIRLLDVQTGEERRLVPDSQVGNLYPTWSPDGSMVAFLSNRSGHPEIWVIGRDGSNLRQLTATNTRHSGPVWLSQKEGK